MKKTLMISLAAAAVLSGSLNAATTEDRISAMEAEITELKKELAGNGEQISTINRNTNGNHIKFDIDFRTAYDNIQYEMANGDKVDNDGLLTNRLWMGMNWLYNENLSFTGQLAYYSTYGQRFSEDPMTDTGMAGFDWVSSEKPYDDELRVRKAYFFLKDDTLAGADIPWTFSIGRRPSTNGKLIAYRDDDHSASPLGHAINVEFDGLSAKANFEEITGIPGLSLKLCAGRGGTYAQSWASATPYAEIDQSIDLGGVIFTPYDDGQYSLHMMYYYAANLIDQDMSLYDPTDTNSDGNNDSNVLVTTPTGPDNFAAANGSFKTVGDLESFTASFISDGIGEDWSDFLDETIFFLSGSMSKTKPNDGADGFTMSGQNEMLGSTESKNGYSYWVGLQMPSLISEEGRFGLEFNHGSKYWRPVTYGEDTMVGSKIAARGDAYEAYFTEPLIDNVFSLQVRYTYIDYKYSGSNGFFGSSTGMPVTMEEAVAYGMGNMVVDKAQDIRVYLRYRY
ncbi:MAG: DUF3373 family protein [Campylobacterota bacterium]|nr:DUF3373 family protein [Campylobacterota bacterium]